MFLIFSSKQALINNALAAIWKVVRMGIKLIILWLVFKLCCIFKTMMVFHFWHPVTWWRPAYDAWVRGSVTSFLGNRGWIRLYFDVMLVLDFFSSCKQHFCAKVKSYSSLRYQSETRKAWLKIILALSACMTAKSVFDSGCKYCAAANACSRAAGYYTDICKQIVLSQADLNDVALLSMHQNNCVATSTGSQGFTGI